jgi:cathepsin D
MTGVDSHDSIIQSSFNFGGQTWSVIPDDFIAGQLSQSTCVSSFFENSDNTPIWTLGDTFLVRLLKTQGSTLY